MPKLRVGMPPNAVNFSARVARSNLFGRVGTHFASEIQLFSSHCRKNHLTTYERSDYECNVIRKFTALHATRLVAHLYKGRL